MRRNLWGVAGAVVCLIGLLAGGQPATDVVKLTVEPSEIEVPAGGTAEIVVWVDISPGWHVNAHEPSLPTLIPTELELLGLPGLELAEVSYPEPIYERFDFAGQELAVYEGAFSVRAKVAASPEAVGAGQLGLVLNYQACDYEVCLPPASARAFAHVQIGPPVAGAETDAQASTDPLADNIVARLVRERSVMLALAVVFVLGLGLNLTPCVYPMIPITVGFFGQQASGRGGRLLGMALAYQLGIVLTYASLGVVAGLTGGLFGAALQSPAVLVAVAAVIVILAFSLLGAYQLKPPVAITRRIGGRAGFGLLGALTMGALAGLVAAPCVGPVTVALLAFVGATQDPWLGLGLFGSLALGLGAPYVALALLSGRLSRLPRTGGWTLWVERLLGWIMLGLALYFVRPLLPEPWFAWLGAGLALAGAVYLVVFAARGHGGRLLGLLRAGAAVLGVALAVWIMWPTAVEGGGIAWQPYSDALLHEGSDSPVLIYFYADWCIPCREMERTTFQDEMVLKGLHAVRPVKADLTRAGDPQAQAIVARYGVRGVPTFVLLGSGGEELTRHSGALSSEAFLRFLNAAAPSG